MTVHELAEEELCELTPGVTLGDFILLCPLGRGGMATVWAACRPGELGIEKYVAVKAMLPELVAHADFVRMFLDEARVAASVLHPNVCEFFEFGVRRHVPYIAMELVLGESLATLLSSPSRERAIAAPVAARIVADACAGLHAAHNATNEKGEPLNVIHRDVSPQNILVNLDGVTKLLDFGIASVREQLHAFTRTGEIKGKACFLSPEQVRGEPLDARIDVFAMGSVLYNATIGLRPFDENDSVDTMERIASGDFVRPRDVDPNYSPQLEAIVLRALALNPAERFPSAAAMRDALENWLLGCGVVVTGTTVGEMVKARAGEGIRDRVAQMRAARRSVPFSTPTPLLSRELAASSTPDVSVSGRSGASPIVDTRGRQPLLADVALRSVARTNGANESPLPKIGILLAVAVAIVAALFAFRVG